MADWPILMKTICNKYNSLRSTNICFNTALRAANKAILLDFSAAIYAQREILFWVNWAGLIGFIIHWAGGPVDQ